MAGDDELARLGPGEAFGELSVIDQQPRVASGRRCGRHDLPGARVMGPHRRLIERDASLAMNLLGSWPVGCAAPTHSCVTERHALGTATARHGSPS